MSAPETPASTGASALVAILGDCVRRAEHRDLTLGEVLDSIQEASYAFIGIVLTLPFLQPLSLGPLAIGGGLVFALLGWQCLGGHHAPVLPGRVRAASLTRSHWEVLLQTCIRLLGWCGKFTRPRHARWVAGDRGHRLLGGILLAGGLLMAVPFFGLPFNNALPALAIFFACLAQLEQDGFMVFVALGWIAATLLYFFTVLALLVFMGREALTLFGW